MPRTTPFHPRTSAHCHSFLWKEWNGFAAVRTYDAHSEEEYFSVRHKAGLIDVSPLCKYDVSGPDAAVLAYTVHERVTVDGKSVTLDAADASTWVRRGGQWRCALHTESIQGDPFGRDRATA